MIGKDYLELKKALQSITGFRPNTDFMLEEERIDPFPFSKGSYKAEIIDSSAKSVSSVEPAHFSSVYFLDGVQRTILLGETNGFPVFMHLSGAAVIKRSGKRLTPFGEPPSLFCIITHKNVKIDSSVRVEFVEDFDFADMSAFTQRSSLLRKRLEQDLFKKAARFVGGKEVMIFDGPLFYTEGLSRSNVLGVIKRHSVLYLPDRKTLSSLSVGERSPVFVLERGKEGAKARITSFYLRLFQRRDPFYGLVRVEVPEGLADSSESVDKVAAFVFSERFPLNLAAQQADKKLYPISVCEKYLSSKIPSTD